MTEQPWRERPIDFAHKGMTASQAYQQILDLMNEQDPDQVQTLTRVQMTTWIEATPDEPMSSDQRDGYGESTRHCAKVVLDHYRAHPGDIFLEPMRLWQMARPELIQRLGEQRLPTCFQWGWAINAARFCLRWDEMPNLGLMHLPGDKVAFLMCTPDDYAEILEGLKRGDPLIPLVQDPE